MPNQLLTNILDEGPDDTNLEKLGRQEKRMGGEESTYL